MFISHLNSNWFFCWNFKKEFSFHFVGITQSTKRFYLHIVVRAKMLNEIVYSKDHSTNLWKIETIKPQEFFLNGKWAGKIIVFFRFEDWNIFDFCTNIVLFDVSFCMNRPSTYRNKFIDQCIRWLSDFLSFLINESLYKSDSIPISFPKI